jgi:hypothetical protein
MQRIALCLAVGIGLSFSSPPVDAQITARPSNPLGAAVSSQFGTAVPTTRSAETNQIRGWYRDYLGREVGPELSAWVELLRGGMSATDVQATILGSDEFYSQKGRDLQTFVRETLQSVTWADPSYSELQRWTDRLNQLRGDRFALAREILQAYAQPQSQGNQVGDTASRLTAAVRLAIETIDFEIGGTPQGRQANLQAQALLGACGQLQQTTPARSSRPDDATLSLDAADRSYQALQATLNNPPGAAPSATGIVRRIGTMLADMRAALRPTASAPPLPPLTGPGGATNSQQLLEQVTAARRAIDSLTQLLSTQAYQDYTYSVVLRDLNTFASQLTALEQAVRVGTSRDQLVWQVQSLRDIADRIRPQLAVGGRQPYFMRLYWQSVESSLEQIRETVGGPGDVSSTVLRPTELHQRLLPLLDQAASQLDVFLAGTNPLVYGVPDVPSVQRDIRNLKSRVLTMRQQAGSGEPASVLKATLSAMVGDYQDAFDRWNRIVTANNLINPARLSPVGETLNRVEQMINDALASGDLASAGPTRIGQLLTSLSSEVAESRRLLTAFAGYREQQSLDLYLQQLDGYAQTINDALTRGTSVDAKRLAVGMQGVVGRMQSEVSGLIQRATTVDVQQRAGDLRTRADRIGRLVDDIESQLY